VDRHDTRRQALTVRAARWSATHPWRAMALWVLFVATCTAVGNVSGTTKATNAGNIGETGRASQIIKAGDFPTEPSVERVMISSLSGGLDVAAATAAAQDVSARMRALAGVSAVDGPLPSPDGTALLLSVRMTGDPATAADRVRPLLDTTAAVARDHPAVRVEEVGWASMNKGLTDTIVKDFRQAELFSIPVTLLILLIAFGALIAAGVPVLLGMSAVGSAIGLSALASHLIPTQDSTSSVILLIGLAVGVDYSLFYLKREREERALGAGHLAAVEIAAATSGRAVVISGIAVMISMAGMFLANDAIFSSISVGSILVVLVSVIGSITVLPALLAKLGRVVDRPRVPLLWRITAARTQASGETATPRFWSTVLTPALRYPLVTLIISAGALVVLAVPALGMNLKLSGLQDIPRTVPAMRAYDRMTAAFPSTGSQHIVVVKAPASQLDQVRAAMADLTARAGTDPLFAHDQRPELTVSPNGLVTMLKVATPYAVGSPAADRSLARLRHDLVPATLGPVPGAEYAVTGDIAGNLDYSQHIKQKLPLVVGFVLLLTFLVMAWTFRSVVVAVTAIGLNMLSVGAAYGLLVVVFQHTWAQRLLDFQSTGTIISWLPMFLFVVLFGLSMDYHVFVVSRIREAVLRGVPNREAVAYGIARSAGVVTSAAVVMVGVFSIFGTLSTMDMKELGVGLASAILIDATIIRAVVLPSVMTLLGNANWWAPRFLRSRGSAGAGEPTAPADLTPIPDLTPTH
jgi:RND superfamily putative drug exporter